jgi:hypothetical protein
VPYYDRGKKITECCKKPTGLASPQKQIAIQEKSIQDNSKDRFVASNPPDCNDLPSWNRLFGDLSYRRSGKPASAGGEVCRCASMENAQRQHAVAP